MSIRRSTVWLVLSFLGSLASGCGPTNNTASDGGAVDSGSDTGNPGTDSGKDSGGGEAAPPEAGGEAGTPSWAASALDGNAVSAIAVDPKAPTTVFVGLSSGGSSTGVYRTKDGGKNWSALTNGVPAQGVHALAVHATQSFVIASAGIGIYRSTDGGDSWTESMNDPGDVFSVVFHPTQNMAWTVTTQNGIYTSTDGGGSWVHVTSTGLPPLNTVGLGPLAYDGSKLYLGTGGQGVYVSSDGGTTFTGPGTGLPQAFADTVNALVATAARPGVVLALTNADGLYRSNDSGATWSKVTMTDRTRYGALLIDPRSSNGFYVSVDDTQGGPGGLDHSGDDGMTWAAFGPMGVPVAVVDESPADGTLYAGTIGKGVWRYGL